MHRIAGKVILCIFYFYKYTVFMEIFLYACIYILCMAVLLYKINTKKFTKKEAAEIAETARIKDS